MTHLKRYFAILINFAAACQQIKKPALQEASAGCGWVSRARPRGKPVLLKWRGNTHGESCSEMSPRLPKLLGSPFWPSEPRISTVSPTLCPQAVTLCLWASLQNSNTRAKTNCFQTSLEIICLPPIPPAATAFLLQFWVCHQFVWTFTQKVSCQGLLRRTVFNVTPNLGFLQKETPVFQLRSWLELYLLLHPSAPRDFHLPSPPPALLLRMCPSSTSGAFI